jgi:hypothetical protein
MQRWRKDGLPPALTGAAAADSGSDYTETDDDDSDPMQEDEEETARDERDHVCSGRGQRAASGESGGRVDPEMELREAERQISRLKLRVAAIKHQLRVGPTEAAAPAQREVQMQAGVGRVAAGPGPNCVLCQAQLVQQPQLLTPRQAGQKNAPAGPTQCKACAKVGHAFYCCAAHQVQDAERHSNECTAMRDRVIQRLILAGRDGAARLKVAAAAAAGGGENSFRVGLSSDHDVQVHRSAEPEAAGVPAPTPSGDPLAKYAERVVHSQALGRAPTASAPAPSAAAAAAGQQHAVGVLLPRPCVPKPWVSFGSPSSVVLNWLPAGKRFDPREAPKAYHIQQRTIGRGRGRGQSRVGGRAAAWTELEEVHTGSVPAHTVRELR